MQFTRAIRNVPFAAPLSVRVSEDPAPAHKKSRSARELVGFGKLGLIARRADTMLVVGFFRLAPARLLPQLAGCRSGRDSSKKGDQMLTKLKLRIRAFWLRLQFEFQRLKIG